MQELLLVLACSTNNGCEPTLNRYLLDYPQVRRDIEQVEINVNRLIGPYAANALAFSQGKVVSAKIKTHTLSINKTDVTWRYEW